MTSPVYGGADGSIGVGGLEQLFSDGCRGAEYEMGQLVALDSMQRRCLLYNSTSWLQ